ncbi:MAG: MASE1 domain-containing protein, partial [Xanthobacteraceae bacterium]
MLPAINPAATPLWPPTGVALAFVLLRGYRVWPAILVSSFSANAVSSGTMMASWLYQSTSIAIGTTLAALAGAWLINRRSYGSNTFFTPLGIGRFVLIAFVPTAMMSSASAMLGQLSTSDLNFSSLIIPSVSWWLADAAGTILIAPVIVLWAMPPRQAVAKWDLLETTAILVAATVIGAITFIPVTIGAFNELLSQQRQFSFLILLPLIWAGLRGNQRAAATAALIFCGLAAWSSPPDASGSLAATGLNGSLLFLLALSIGTSVASLLLSAVIAGYRDRQEGAKRHFQIFVESVSDYAIFVLDPSGHVASWNGT